MIGIENNQIGTLEGSKLGLNWVCFGFVLGLFFLAGILIFFISLCKYTLCINFGLSTNWVCFGFVLALIGFVFTKCPIVFIFIIHCIVLVYVHLTFLELGLFCIKRADL